MEWGAFIPDVKRFGYKIGIQFNKSALVIDQNNFLTKIVNASTLYDLDDWPKILLNNFALKNYLFGATNMAKDW